MRSPDRLLCCCTLGLRRWSSICHPPAWDYWLEPSRGPGRPLRGAIVGALLSAVLFELLLLPCLSLIGMLSELSGEKDTQQRLFMMSLRYAAEMGVAGALAGAIGGAVGQAALKRQEPTAAEDPPKLLDDPLSK